MEDGALLSSAPEGGSRTRTAHRALPSGQRALRHGGYLALTGLRAITSALPRRLALAAGEAAGRLAGAMPGSTGRRVREHLALAFPELAVPECAALARRIHARLGRNMAEVLRLHRYGRQEILGLADFEGLPHLDEALAGKKGVLLVTGHVGCWELMAAAIVAKGYPLNVIAREVYDPRMDELLVATRARHGVKTIQRNDAAAAREILRTLKRGEILGLLIDVDIKAAGAFVPFFGRPAWTPTGAAAFSARAGAPVVMGFASWEGLRHRIRFEPPLHPAVTGDRDADLVVNTARYTSRIEAAVRLKPEDWVWTHRRWRRVPGPGGEPYLPHKLPPS